MDITTIVGVVVLAVVGGFAIALLNRFISLLQRSQPTPPPAPPVPPQPPAQPAQPQTQQPLNPYLRELDALDKEAEQLSGELTLANREASNARLMVRAAQQGQLAVHLRAQAWEIYTGGQQVQPRPAQPGAPQPGGQPKPGAPKPGVPAPGGGPVPAPKPQPKPQPQARPPTPPPSPAGPPPIP